MVNDLLKKNKSVILIGGHYGNWEWLITSKAFQFDGKAYGLGMPMSNKFWGQAINKKRERFGLKVIHSKNYKEALSEEKIRTHCSCSGIKVPETRIKVIG